MGGRRGGHDASCLRAPWTQPHVLSRGPHVHPALDDPVDGDRRLQRPHDDAGRPTEHLVETWARPSGTSFTLSGRGFGHGLGMSQYGAYGAALKGLGRDSILAFYYPARRVRRPRQPDDQVRLGTAVGSGGTQVVHQSGLTVGRRHAVDDPFRTNSDGTARLRWRAVPDGTGLTSSGSRPARGGASAAGRRSPPPCPWSNTTTGMRACGPAGGSQRDYRRTVRTIRSGSAAPAQRAADRPLPAQRRPLRDDPRGRRRL